jgi:hypothetical protein
MESVLHAIFRIGRMGREGQDNFQQKYIPVPNKNVVFLQDAVLAPFLFKTLLCWVVNRNAKKKQNAGKWQTKCSYRGAYVTLWLTMYKSSARMWQRVQNVFFYVEETKSAEMAFDLAYCISSH